MAAKGADVTAAERRIKALAMRREGKSYRKIGQLLGVSGKTAFKDVERALKTLLKEQNAEADQLIQLQRERLNMALAAIATSVKRGDLYAIDRWIKINEAICKLEGLNAPEKHDITTHSHEDALDELD